MQKVKFRMVKTRIAIASDVIRYREVDAKSDDDTWKECRALAL